MVCPNLHVRWSSENTRRISWYQIIVFIPAAYEPPRGVRISPATRINTIIMIVYVHAYTFLNTLCISACILYMYIIHIHHHTVVSLINRDRAKIKIWNPYSIIYYIINVVRVPHCSYRYTGWFKFTAILSLL